MFAFRYSLFAFPQNPYDPPVPTPPHQPPYEHRIAPPRHSRPRVPPRAPSLLAPSRPPMLVCGIDDAKPGMILGADVTDPRSPDLALLRAGVPVDAAILSSLRRRGIADLWVEDD